MCLLVSRPVPITRLSSVWFVVRIVYGFLSQACYNCGEIGHMARDCTKERSEDTIILVPDKMFQKRS